MEHFKLYINVVYLRVPPQVTRKEFFMFLIINAIVSLVMMGIDTLFQMKIWEGYGPLYLGYIIWMIYPNIKFQIARLRDAGYTWKSLLWLFLPIIGPIIVIWRLFKPSKEGDWNSVIAYQ
jgi:uncharacterized membrane protein YhaH (DUF805 family)